MLRTSSYTIYVDLPSDPENMLLVHGYTGAYDLVSRPVATFVRSLERKRPPKPLFGAWKEDPPDAAPPPRPPEPTVAKLRRRGYLTPLGFEEEEEFVRRVANNLHERTRSPSYILVTNYDCNLRCPYCFQTGMRDEARQKGHLGVMPPELIDRIFDVIPKIERSYGIDPETRAFRSFGLFGGEPLLRSARPAVDHLFQRAQDLGAFNFYTITNGTEIDAYEDLLGPGGISFLQITLDGPPSVHDTRRVYADGSGSFERIGDNVTLALDRGANVSIRVNIDRQNLHQLPVLADSIREHGWPDRENFDAYCAPVFADNGAADPELTFTSWELHRLLQDTPELAAVLDVIRLPGGPLKRKARTIFTGGPGGFPLFKATSCGAHNATFIFDPVGAVYPCWEWVGEQGYRIGRLTSDADLELDQKESEKWRSRNVTTNLACLRCRYAFYCGGGCGAQAEERKGDFFLNNCDGFRSRFRAAVAEAYAEHLAEQTPPDESNPLEECTR